MAEAILHECYTEPDPVTSGDSVNYVAEVGLDADQLNRTARVEWSAGGVQLAWVEGSLNSSGIVNLQTKYIGSSFVPDGNVRYGTWSEIRGAIGTGSFDLSVTASVL